MGAVDRKLIAYVVIIMATGIYKFFLVKDTSKHTTLTRIIIGGYMLGLFASLFDLVGSGLGQVANWMLLLAAGVAVLTVIQDIYDRYNNVATATSGGGSSSKLS